MENFVTKQRYIHLLPVERSLWDRWLKLNEQGWSAYEYDVHVGEGIVYGGSEDQWAIDLAKLLTQKRIDVLAYRQGVPWLFEVKPQAGLSGFGQLLAYRELYRRHFKYAGPLELAIVTDILNPDEDYLYRGSGIHVFLV